MVTVCCLDLRLLEGECSFVYFLENSTEAAELSQDVLCDDQFLTPREQRALVRRVQQLDNNLNRNAQDTNLALRG